MKTQRLAKHHLISLQHTALQIEILSGEVWLTCTGDSTDYVLTSAVGMRNIPINSNIVIEALEESLLKITEHYSGQEKVERTALHLSNERSIEEAESTCPASTR